MKRAIVIFDGIFSMRGETAPIDEIERVVAPHRDRFEEGLLTVVDDSHGVGAFGRTGRGTEEFCGQAADVTVGTFGKAFGVNGGFVAGSEALTDLVRQKADTYIYTNPLSVADCAAAGAALKIVDSKEGLEILARLHARVKQFREGLDALGFETIAGPHPVVPLMVRDAARCKAMVHELFERGVMAVGLTFPVVPENEDTIRFQVNAGHTVSDIEYVLEILGDLKA